MLIVMLSFVLFNGESMRQVGSDFAGLFGFAGLPAVTRETLYYLLLCLYAFPLSLPQQSAHSQACP